MVRAKLKGTLTHVAGDPNVVDQNQQKKKKTARPGRAEGGKNQKK